MTRDYYINIFKYLSLNLIKFGNIIVFIVHCYVCHMKIVEFQHLLTIQTEKYLSRHYFTKGSFQTEKNANVTSVFSVQCCELAYVFCPNHNVSITCFRPKSNVSKQFPSCRSVSTSVRIKLKKKKYFIAFSKPFEVFCEVMPLVHGLIQ